jgi:hypothetical protein
MASIVYDRYTRGATITWVAPEYTGPIIVPAQPQSTPTQEELTQEEIDAAIAKKNAEAAAVK